MVASRSLLRLAGALACVLPTSHAAIVSDDFNDGNDQGWTHYDPLGPFGGGGSFTVSAGRYHLHAPISPNPAALGAGRAGSLRLDASVTDFFLTVDIVDWDDISNQAFGLLSRIREVGLGTTDGYGFLYVPVDHDFEIARFDNEADHRIGPIIGISLDPARDYRITFAGTGNELTGEVFDLGDLSTPLLTLTAIDDAYPSGVTGLIVADASSAGAVSDATFDNYALTVPVPEPSCATLLLATASLLGRRMRLSSRSPTHRGVRC